MTDVKPSTLAMRSVVGVSTGAGQKISRNGIENLLRRLGVAPVEEFARLQVARLHAMILKLVGRGPDGDLARARLAPKLHEAGARLESKKAAE